jgi:hypothetical protein
MSSHGKSSSTYVLRVCTPGTESEHQHTHVRLQQVAAAPAATDRIKHRLYSRSAGQQRHCRQRAASTAAAIQTGSDSVTFTPQLLHFYVQLVQKLQGSCHDQYVETQL